MELTHLLRLVAELPRKSTLSYVRGTDSCRFIDVDIQGKRINSETPTKEPKSWAPTYLQELAPKIKENVPFNLSGLLNNKGSFRPVLETIIAHTREFYTVRKGSATALVWIPSKPKTSLELEEIDNSEIPSPVINEMTELLLNKDGLINKVRDSFTHFVHLINTHTNDFTGYIAKFEDFVNPRLSKSFPQYSSIFQIVDIDVLHTVVAKMKEVEPTLEKVFTSEYNGTQYQAFRTMRYYEMYLDILADSDFRANIVQNREQRLSVASTAFNNHPDYLRAMRTKPFLLLAGISGTGKSRIVKQMAFDSCPNVGDLRKDETSPGNYCLIEVKPNWHDSTELLGYESKINGAHYVLTPFVRFLVKAMLYPEVPFFVCLDEMNLAPVEQYFAEFLSVLESRTKVGDRIVSEPLVKAEIFSKYSDLSDKLFSKSEEATHYDNVLETSDAEPRYGKEAEVYDSLKEYGLRIPENVVVIGTVNMDETTHQFSRKVIDRAMTIEMNLPEGNPFMDFYNNASQLVYRDNPTSASLYLSTEVKASDVVDTLAAADAEKTDRLKSEVARFLGELNTTLDGTPFKVAYRVQNELLLYFYQLWREDNDADWEKLLDLSCDQILMMKVLPRIEGDEELLEKPLERLASFCTAYPEASKKIAEMKSRLDQSHFASFWP